MKHKLKIYLPLLMGAIAAVCIAAVVYGAGSAEDKVNNHLQLPAVEGGIEENFDKPTTVTPGTAVKKEVSIKNEGTTAMFVRAMALPEIKSAADVLLPASIGSGSAEIVQVDLGSTWIDGKDGYYYYTKKIAAGEAVPAGDRLFTSVKLKSSLGGEYKDAAFTMQLKIETVSASDHQYRSVWWGLEENAAPTSSPYTSIDTELDAAM